jgi:2-oxoacid:acceptor oxidoreductase gamma subunit (pyruvate/2-ketoisovalerate family)
MIEIRIHGRGGQGGVTLAKILASAHHIENRSVQAFGIYAAERSGAPLQAFLRYDDQPIHNPNQIYEPDHLIVLDPTLVSPAIVSGLKSGGFILINTSQAPAQLAEPSFSPYRLATVDATAIALKQGLGTRAVPIVNTALAGAVARISRLKLDSVIEALQVMGFHDGNVAAARMAHEGVRMRDAASAPAEIITPSRKPARAPGLIEGNSGAPPAIHTGQWARQQPWRENGTPPCNFICPAGNDVQGFLAALSDENVDEALNILLRTSPLPSVCGRVCPGFCMQQCNRASLEGPVNIRALERYAGDHGVSQPQPQRQRTERVAVVGAGPAGLSAAYHLALLGYPVSLFEAGPELGGLMRTGIPVYRLPREALDRDIDRILKLGIETVTDTRIDHDRLLELTAQFDAVLAATGLQRRVSLELGPDQSWLMQGLEFLDLARNAAVRVDGEDVLIVGGGNTAVDAARSAFRLGARSVRIVYRRTREEMPAIAEEVDEAIDEGIEIDFLCSPLRISSDENGPMLTCQRMKPGTRDESGRRRPVPVAGSETAIPCDRVILALGQAADLSVLPANAVLSRAEPLRTAGKAPVYPAGDLLSNEGTVTAAIGCGREMALRLHEQFSGQKLYADPSVAATVVRADAIKLHHFERSQAQQGQVLPFSGRESSFAEVHQGLDSAEEAKRCLSCGVCNGCDRCVTYCPDGLLSRQGDELVFDYEYCKGCGVCVTECSRAVIYMKTGEEEAA